MTYHIKPFGSPQVLNEGGGPIKFRSGKALELILLLVFRGLVTRKIAGRLLWPEHETERQLANLRLSLTYINQAAPGLIRIDMDSIQVTDAQVDFDAGLPENLLSGIEAEWADIVRHEFEERWFEENLEKAKQSSDLILAQRLKRQDPLRQEPRLLIASLWMEKDEPAKAAAELEEYATRIRAELGLELGEDIYIKVGLQSPKRLKSPAQIFGAVGIEEKVASVLGSCPLWLMGGRILNARARIEDLLTLKGINQRDLAELYGWKARFAVEGGDIDSALESAKEFARLAVPSQRNSAALCELRVRVFRHEKEHANELISQLQQRKLTLSQQLEFSLICGVSEYNSNDLETGRAFAERAAKISRELDSLGAYARAKGLVGSCEFRLGNIQEAILAFSESIEICSRFGLSILLAHYHGSRGRCHEAENDLAKAESDYTQGIEIVSTTEASATFAILATYLGELLVRKGKVAMGIEWLKKGEGARRQTGERLGRSTSYRCLAKAYLALGDLHSASDQCGRAISISGAHEWDFEDALNRVVLAQIETRGQRYPQAISNLRIALPILEKQRAKGFSNLAEDTLFDPVFVLKRIRELEAIA
ncbi:MAG: tetratricopeptide repeat protein [Fimbriimonadaceae bacterium]|nr:MAG: tetratricopeptide repeat protein [Fimbriimonadaceae bacterium]